MVTIEDSIRQRIQASETQLFELRQDGIKYFTFADGKLAVDPRYAAKTKDISAREKTLIETIGRAEGALSRAAQLAGRVPGIDHRSPLSSLQVRSGALQGEINSLQTDITVYRRRIEVHGPQTTGEWKERIKEYEKRLKELRPELQKVEEIRKEIEDILRGL